jgi:hypothetical protein
MPAMITMSAMESMPAMDDWNEDAYLRPHIPVRIWGIVWRITAVIDRNGNTSRQHE